MMDSSTNDFLIPSDATYYLKREWKDTFQKKINQLFFVLLILLVIEQKDAWSLSDFIEQPPSRLRLYQYVMNIDKVIITLYINVILIIILDNKSEHGESAGTAEQLIEATSMAGVLATHAL